MLVSQNDMLLKMVARGNDSIPYSSGNAEKNDTITPLFVDRSPPSPLDTITNTNTNLTTNTNNDKGKTSSLTHQSLLPCPPENPTPENDNSKHRLTISNAHNHATIRATKGTSSSELVAASIRPIKEIKCNSITRSFLEDARVSKMLKERFLEVPGKCTVRDIGYEVITDEGLLTTYKQQKNIISPWLSKALFIQGNRDLTYGILTVAQICELIYIVESIIKGLSPEVSSVHLVVTVIMSIVYAIINLVEVKDYSKPASTWTLEKDECYFTDSTFLMMYGLDSSIKREDELRNGEGTNQHRVVKNKMRRDALFKSAWFCCLTLSFGYLLLLFQLRCTMILENGG